MKHLAKGFLILLPFIVGAQENSTTSDADGEHLRVFLDSIIEIRSGMNVHDLLVQRPDAQIDQIDSPSSEEALKKRTVDLLESIEKPNLELLYSGRYSFCEGKLVFALVTIGGPSFQLRKSLKLLESAATQAYGVHMSKTVSEENKKDDHVKALPTLMWKGKKECLSIKIDIESSETHAVQAWITILISSGEEGVPISFPEKVVSQAEKERIFEVLAEDPCYDAPLSQVK